MSEKSKSTSTPETSSKSSDSGSTEKATGGNSEGGKSSRDSVGGASGVHYGYFSNVKSPQYRSGWDEIWSTGSETKKKKPARAKAPILISMDLDELPEELQKGLADFARARLKKSRISYDNRARAGAVAWRINCEVKR